MSAPGFKDQEEAKGRDDKTRGKKAQRTRSTIEADGREQYFQLRKHWSTYLMWALSASIIYQGVIVWTVGNGYLPFKDHQVFLNAVSAELFLQIAAMCLILVRCLFPSTESKSRKKKRGVDPVRLEITGPGKPPEKKDEGEPGEGEGDDDEETPED